MICHVYRGLDVYHVMHVMMGSKVTVLGQLHPLVQVFEFSGGCSASKRLDPKLEHGINVDDSDNGSKHYPLTQSVSAVKRSSSRFLDAPLLPPSVDIPGRDSPSIHSL